MAVALVLAVQLATGSGPPWRDLEPALWPQAITELKAHGWPERLARATDRFLGTAYQLSPLGEGQGLDGDPLVRFDAVDCLTLVEEALALGHAEGPHDVLPRLNAIRYRAGEPGWANRLHLMEAQWIPHTLASGLVVDVTRAFGGRHTRTVAKVLTAETWAHPMGQRLKLPGPLQPRGRFELDIIPAAVALEVLGPAPSGLIVVVVRADRPQAVTRISHVAVLIHTPQGPVLRHASRTFGRVVDEPLARFLARNLAHGAWTVEGLALLEPTAGAAR